MSTSAESTGTCHGCGRELLGAVEIVLIRRGPFVSVDFKETPDCNWVKCSGCGRAVCKSCGRFLELLGKIWKDHLERARPAVRSDRNAVPNAARHTGATPSPEIEPTSPAAAYGTNGGTNRHDS